MEAAKLQRSATARARSRKRLGLAILKWSAVGGLAMAALGSVLIAAMFWHYGSDPDLPKISSLGDYQPKQATRVVTEDGRIIGELFEERRTYVPIDQIPPAVIQAFIAAEDASFFEHSGLDYVGMVRAVFVNLREGKKAQGASTITQQVVKTFLLSPERTFRRKFQEIILARRLEDALSKDDILTLYLNQIYFGHGRYGVQEAAKYYFGKEIADVHPGEAAVLAGLPKAPERLSPKKPANAERAKARQIYVLEQMVKNGFLDEAEAIGYIDAPIEVIADAFPNMNVAPEWVDLARRELVARYGEQAVGTLGGEVVVTVDLAVQELAAQALRKGLRELDAREGYGRPRARLKQDRIPKYLARLKRRLPKGGPNATDSYDAVVLAVHDAEGDAPGELVVDLGDWKAAVVLSGETDARLNPDGKSASERFGRGDLIRVVRGGDATPRHAERAVELAPGPEGAIVAMDPHTRRVLAVVGGYGTRVADFNRATMARRQAGSTFKPFVYAAAIDSGEFTAASIVNDAPEVYDLWKPENYEKGEFLGPIRLREALARSINTVAIRVIHTVGPQRVADLAQAMGIESELPPHLSLALGSGEVTPLEMTNAFATLAAGGIAMKPRFVERVGDQAVPAPQAEPVLSSEVAYVVTDMLRSVVTEGTGGRARGIDLPISGKTGTTNDARDAWFIGMTPEIIVGVWVGFDEPRRLGRKESGSRTALPIFVYFMESLQKQLRNQPFERPPGVVEVRVDRATGLLAPAGATDETSYPEVFLEGTAPTEYALTDQEVDVDSFVLEQYDDGDDALLGEELVDGDDEEPLGATP